MKTKIRWFLGVILILISLGYFSTSFLGAILILISGLFILPLSGNIFFNKLRLQDNTKAKWGIVIVLWTLGIGVMDSDADEKAIDALSQVEELINAGAINEAKQFLNNNEKENKFSTKFKNLKLRVDKASDKDFQQSSLGKMADYEFELLEEKKLEKTYFESIALNKYFLAQLFEIRSERKEILDKMKADQAKRKADEAAKKAKKEAKKAKKESSNHFSIWNGSHKGCVKFVKENLLDPGSFKHIKTEVWGDEGSDTFDSVVMTYSAKNRLGLDGIGEAFCKCDSNGNIIKNRSRIN